MTSQFRSTCRLALPVHPLTTVLHNATLLSVEQITMPDATVATQYDAVQKIALDYQGIDRTEYPLSPHGCGALI